MSDKYNTKTVGSIWMSQSKAGTDYVSVPIVGSEKDGKPNTYFKGSIYFEDSESGKVYQIKKFKTFMSNRHPDILADLCVELSDEAYSVPVVEEE